MVYLPLWNILISQLGWLFPINMESHEIPWFQTTIPSHIFGPSSVTLNGPWRHRHIVRGKSGLHELGGLCQGQGLQLLHDVIHLPATGDGGDGLSLDRLDLDSLDGPFIVDFPIKHGDYTIPSGYD